MTRPSLFAGAIALAVALVVPGCKESPAGNQQADCAFTGGEPVSLVSPKNGDRFKTGDTVVLAFRVDRNQITSIQTEVSNDNGENWIDIASAALPVPTGAQFQCMTQKWVVGKENVNLAYAASDTAILWIHQYSKYDVGVLFDTVKILIQGF